MNWLNRADIALLNLINKQWNLPALDNIMLIIRQPFTWIPVYLFFFLFFYGNCRRYFVPIVLMSVVTFALTDFISASLLKPLIGRLRPCHNSDMGFVLNNIAGCGGPFSMPSTHATNHFGLSTLWFLMINHMLQKKWYWLGWWAAGICYAQVYVGVHFPFDILVGALSGIGIACGTFYYFKKWITKSDLSTIHMQNHERKFKT